MNTAFNMAMCLFFSPCQAVICSMIFLGSVEETTRCGWLYPCWQQNGFASKSCPCPSEPAGSPWGRLAALALCPLLCTPRAWHQALGVTYLLDLWVRCALFCKDSSAKQAGAAVLWWFPCVLWERGVQRGASLTQGEQGAGQSSTSTEGASCVFQKQGHTTPTDWREDEGTAISMSCWHLFPKCGA